MGCDDGDPCTQGDFCHDLGCAATSLDMTCSALSGSLQVLEHAGHNVSIVDSHIQSTLYLANETADPISLSGVTLRYWYTSENPGAADEDFVDFCGATGASTPTSPCASVTTAFASTARVTANRYLEVSFDSGSVCGAAPGGQENLQYILRIQKTDGTFYQANDWSFRGSFNVAEPAPRITLYRDGVLIWGNEPPEL